MTVINVGNHAVRLTLVPATVHKLTFFTRIRAVDIMNYGPGDIYVDMDSVAAVGGVNDILIPADMAYHWEVRGTSLHIIGASASVVQVVGVR